MLHLTAIRLGNSHPSDVARALRGRGIGLHIGRPPLPLCDFKKRILVGFSWRASRAAPYIHLRATTGQQRPRPVTGLCYWSTMRTGIRSLRAGHRPQLRTGLRSRLRGCPAWTGGRRRKIQRVVLPSGVAIQPLPATNSPEMKSLRLKKYESYYEL